MDDPKGPARERARQLAQRALARGDAVGWFEELYRAAAGSELEVPWAHGEPHPRLMEWLAEHRPEGRGRRALVVGCGLGDDAQAIAAHGFAVTAFDVSPTAIEWCRRLYPQGPVDYRQADLFDLPVEWRGAFDLVLELYTLQALPPSTRPRSLECVGELVAPAGRLLVVTRSWQAELDPDGPPWPLRRTDLAAFAAVGLLESAFDVTEDSAPPGSKGPGWRIEYRRPAAGA